MQEFRKENEMGEIIKPLPGDDTALLPCPFCGSAEVVFNKYIHPADDSHRYAVMCCGCLATIDPGWTVMRSQVAEMWNLRTKAE